MKSILCIPNKLSLNQLKPMAQRLAHTSCTFKLATAGAAPAEPKVNHVTPQVNTAANTTTGITDSISLLTDKEYHQIANKTMEQLLDYFEDLGETIELQDFDILYSV